MKTGTNAKQRREAETRRRRDAWSPKKEDPDRKPPESVPPKAAVKTAEAVPREPLPAIPQKTAEEETREFLEYLERHDIPMPKDEPVRRNGRKAGTGGKIPCMNLEEGMPVVSEAIDRMHMGIQEMRHIRAKAVKLIHGYGSTGRGGKICTGIRAELADMKRKKQIREYIPGEDFGPTDAASRRLADQDRNISRDPDYGRINQGITIVVL